MCSSPWGRKELNTTEQLNQTELKAQDCSGLKDAGEPSSSLTSRPGTMQEKLGTTICTRDSLPLRFICTSVWVAGVSLIEGTIPSPFFSPVFPTSSQIPPAVAPCLISQHPSNYLKRGGTGSLRFYKERAPLSFQILRKLNPCNLDKSDRHYQVRVKPPRMALQLIAETAVIKS